jgi:hypothetical protein
LQGKFKPIINFNIYIDKNENRKKIIKSIINSMNENIDSKDYEQFFSNDTNQTNKLVRQYHGIIKLFEKDPDRFIKLLLRFEMFIWKSAYVKYPDKLIRSRLINFNCLITLFPKQYSAAYNPISSHSNILTSDNIKNLLNIFNALLIFIIDKYKLEINMKGGEIIGKDFFTNQNKKKNWDYNTNQPLIKIDRIKLEEKCNELFLKGEKELQIEVPKEIYGGYNTSIHELTHAYDTDNNPYNKIEEEKNNTYELYTGLRGDRLIQFFSDLLSDSITQWRDRNIFHNKKHIFQNKYILNKSQFYHHLNQSKYKIKLLCEIDTLNDYSPGRFFDIEYYDIGLFYTILYAIKKCIDKNLEYKVHMVKKENIDYENELKKYERGYSIDERFINYIEKTIRNRTKEQLKSEYNTFELKNKDFIKNINHIRNEILSNLNNTSYLEKNGNKLVNYTNYCYLKLGLTHYEMLEYKRDSKEHKSLLSTYENIKKELIKYPKLLEIYSGHSEHKSKFENAYTDNFINNNDNIKEIIINDKNIIKDLMNKEMNVYFLPFENERIVEEVFNELHEMKTSFEFIKLMMGLDKYFNIPWKFRLIKSLKHLNRILDDITKKEIQMFERSGYKFKKYELESYFPKRKFKPLTN